MPILRRARANCVKSRTGVREMPQLPALVPRQNRVLTLGTGDRGLARKWPRECLSDTHGEQATYDDPLPFGPNTPVVGSLLPPPFYSELIENRH